MKGVVAIDPGRTIGVSWVTEDGRFISSQITDDPQTVIQIMEGPNAPSIIAVVIEDYIGAGFRDSDSVYTIKLIGFLYGFSRWRGYKTVMQFPQERKSFLAEALQKLEDTDLKGVTPHHIDSLAHALRYLHDHRKRESA
jgi:hypothetical protein